MYMGSTASSFHNVTYVIKSEIAVFLKSAQTIKLFLKSNWVLVFLGTIFTTHSKYVVFDPETTYKIARLSLIQISLIVN